jgi:rhomboid protease GluP
MIQDPTQTPPESNPYLQQILLQIIKDFSDLYQLDLSQDSAALERIQKALQEARIELESNPEVEIKLPFISANSSGPIHLNRMITRKDFGLEDPNLSDRIELEQPLSSPEKKPQDPRPKSQPVTLTLLIIIVIIYVLQLLTGYLVGVDLPAVFGIKSNQFIQAGEFWRLITPMFLHGSILHIGFNMYALNILGRRVERNFGSARYLALYLAAGITGNVFSFIFTNENSLGSSTAIFGLLGAEGIFIYHNRDLFGEQFQVAIRQILQVAIINLIIGLSPGIDNWGHVGGLLGGIVFAIFAGPQYKLQQTVSGLSLKDHRWKGSAPLVFLIQLAALTIWVLLIIKTGR